VLREAETLHRSGAALPGKVVVLDPGHGGPDRGATGHGWTRRRRGGPGRPLGGPADRRGGAHAAHPGPGQPPTDAERAEFANAAEADVVLSLHVDRRPSPRCQGVASYHFGAGRGTTSTVGEKLASLVQREIVAAPTCWTAGCTRRPGRSCG
jgi:N-acetylmuramoyl-L-alanine amidase